MEDEKISEAELKYLADAIYDKLANNTENKQFSPDLVEDMFVENSKGLIEFTMGEEFGGKTYQLVLTEKRDYDK